MFIIKILVIFTLISIHTSCKKKYIYGIYEKKSDNDFSYLNELDFRKKYCYYAILGISIQSENAKYEIIDDYLYIHSKDDRLGILSLKISHQDTLIGYGRISGIYIKKNND